ncbi:MAG: hypothetical protein LBK24_00970 [Puniceicoccales bacterium]|jgi:hypothetical protein|nr:hypothetical protein [Puniceicoccales bacterium]
MTLQTQENAISLEGLYTFGSETVRRSEQNLNKALERLESGENISQQELIALQTKMSAWTNICNVVSGMLRAVGDALKATAQNIR